MPFLTNEHLTRKVHISLTAIYHLAVHNYFPFFLSVSAEGIVSSLFMALSYVCATMNLNVVLI